MNYTEEETREHEEYLGLIDSAQVYALFDEDGYYETIVMEDDNLFDDEGNLIGSDWHELDKSHGIFTLVVDPTDLEFLGDKEWVEIPAEHVLGMISLMFETEGMSFQNPGDPWHVSEIEPFVNHTFDENSPFWSEEGEQA